MGLFYELFHQQTIDKSIRYIKLLKYKLTNYPTMMQELKQKFLPSLHKILNFP